MAPQRIVVLGAGFAGLWSALGAARQLDRLGIGPERVQVSLVNRDRFHAIRVRNYESDLCPLRVPLDGLLTPVGVELIEAEVVGLDPARRRVQLQGAAGPEELPYDRLVLALGSVLARPPLPGLETHGFDVDTYAGAERLDQHLRALVGRPAAPGLFTAVVVGAGLTGLELACELPGRLGDLLAKADRNDPVRVLLVDHQSRVGAAMGSAALPVIEAALAELGVESRGGLEAAAVTPDGLALKGGAMIPAATVVWCAGLRAHPLTAAFGVDLDQLGRLSVDGTLRVIGVPNVFAAGDVARAPIDAEHASVMSCQHGRPMGRFAGHNVVADLLGLPLLPLQIPSYVTVLDLGPSGALYTEGWDRQLVATGAAAKATKRLINSVRIYPPAGGDRAALLAAAAPELQSVPAVAPTATTTTEAI